MFFTDFTEKYTQDKENRLLLRRINDLIRRSKKDYTVLYSDFLDPAQQSLVSRVPEFGGAVSFDGGYEDAERRMCRIMTDEYQPDPGAPIVLFSVTAAFCGEGLSHRDVLGSLMGLGIRREMIGDILPNGSSPQFFCHSSVAEHIELNLLKISRYSVRLSRSQLPEVRPPVYEERTVNVSAMRLDCIAAEAFSMSRTKAAEGIRKGLAAVNWISVTDPSTELKPGDKLSLRGKGKAEVRSISGTSKKGRLFVCIAVKK